MKVLVTGGSGQVGQALRHSLPDDYEIVAPARDEFDLSKPDELGPKVKLIAPEVVINAAAYTAVDLAEQETEMAMRVNAKAVGALADAARQIGARLVQISTDFVFDGLATEAYQSDAQRKPLSVYGRSKAAGEDAAGTDALIIRTSWVYAPGHKNFVSTMLSLMKKGESLRVVADQVSAPTLALGLAETVWKLVDKRASGVYHHCDAGRISWYEFAEEIQRQSISLGLLKHGVPISAVSTSEFPSAAKRPPFSLLNCEKTKALIGQHQADWRSNLRAMLAQECASD